MKFIKKIFTLSLFLFIGTASPYARTNFFRPYDINFRMAEWKDKNFRIGLNTEYGETGSSRDWDEHKVDTLQLYNQSESSLAMLMGAKRGSQAYDLANYFLAAYGPATDDGVRGHFKVDGRFEDLDLTFWGKYVLPLEKLPGNFEIYLYAPIRHMEIKNVKWNDLTKNVLSADLDVHSLLTYDITSIAQDLGGLNIDSWSKTGIGDIVFLLGWYNDFKQMKEYLKNVRITSRIGLSIPSASKKDEDKVFSLPLGNDGSWMMPFSISLDLDFVNRIKTGLEFEILFGMDETRVRRLKTDENQTDFLLINKGKATKNFGTAYKFNLFLQFERFFKGLSAKVAYQFFKHDDDKLTAESNDFSYHVINSAQSLKEWSYQNFVFQLNYDFFSECKNSWLKPQLSIFYKLPVTGKRVINPHTFGGQIAFNF